MKYVLLVLAGSLLLLVGLAFFFGYLPARAEANRMAADGDAIEQFCARQALADRWNAPLSSEIAACVREKRALAEKNQRRNVVSTPTPAPQPKLSPAELQRILDDTEDECEKAGYGMTCLEMEEQRELNAALEAAADAY